MRKSYQLALLSELIYADWPTVHEGLAALNMHMMGEPFAHADSEGMLVRHNEENWAAIIFRGTEIAKGSWSDLFSNIGFARYWVGIGKAHNGYSRHFAMIRYEARMRAQQVYSHIALYVAGHSMGGSLATMYAAWVGSGGPDDHKLAGLITYGAPKTLDKAATATIKCPVHRYTNKYDFAPHWPPVLGLSHPKPRVRLDSGGWIGPVTRHNIAKYLKALRDGHRAG